jgi:uncharacterized membrane protein YhhN
MMKMDWILIVVFVFALLEWVLEARGNKKFIFIVRPAVMITLIAWVIISVLITGAAFGNLTWFLVGLALCLLGDIFLMLPPEKWFIWGLIGFLLGQVSYIIGFNVFSLVEGTLVPAIFWALILFVVGVGIFRRLKVGLVASGKEKLIIPVAVYSIAISYMLFSAAYSFLNPEWSTLNAYLVSLGALLFYVSDILNAWERFIFSIKNARVIIMSTYHLGQIGLAVGATLHFLG